jgi:hypothetical protein
MTNQQAVKTRRIDTIGGFDLHETTDGQRSLYVTTQGGNDVLGGAWGPAADNANWFAWRNGVDPQRVEDREAAIAYITKHHKAMVAP